MEGGLQTSPQLGYPVDSADAKYVSGLSTILVATIQEAKDRISQIEYIFCSQLYPNFQSKYKSLQKIYSEARKAAEETWKEKEKDFFFQIEKLESEKLQALEENKSLKSEKENLKILLDLKSSVILDNEKMLKELEDKNNILQKNIRDLELEAEGLKWEVKKKSKEADGVMERQIKSLQLVQSKVSLIANKEKQLKEREEITAELLAKLKSMEGKFDELQRELAEKTEQVDSGKGFQESLLKKIQSQALELSKNEHLLNDYEKEKGKLGEKIEEVKELQKEKRLLLARLKGLEENVDKLQMDVRERSNQSTEEMELHGKLLQQIEAKDSELLSEKKRRRDAFDAYKKLKSQYQFLCKKFGLTTENMLPQNRTEDESNSLKHNQSPSTSPGKLYFLCFILTGVPFKKM